MCGVGDWVVVAAGAPTFVSTDGPKAGLPDSLWQPNTTMRRVATIAVKATFATLFMSLLSANDPVQRMAQIQSPTRLESLVDKIQGIKPSHSLHRLMRHGSIVVLSMRWDTEIHSTGYMCVKGVDVQGKCPANWSGRMSI